ncbi:MAG: DUF58 domain-containing protein [Halarchaeum sp.]
MSARHTHRWRGVVAVTLVAVAAGVLAARPDVLLVGVVGAAYAAYPHLWPAPTPAFDVERTLSPADPAPGGTVEVTVTVTNASGDHHPDVRFVDGVPPMLSVSSGSPRHASALRPGESATFSYAVTAERGTYGFEPVTVVARDVSGAREVEGEASAETTLSVVADAAESPSWSPTDERVGRSLADRGGDGVEFHSVRDYRPDDPLSRVDWRRYARSRTLSTVEYRPERASSVVFCVDARPCAYRAREPGEQHAVAHAVAAADRLLTSLAGTPAAVGAAALGAETARIEPGRGRAHATRVRRRLATDSAFSAYPPAASSVDLEARVRRLRAGLNGETHVVWLTPLADRDAVEAALALRRDGHAVTVVSPDVTASGSRGARLAAARRDEHVRTLREGDVPVVDWNPDEPVERAVARASGRWAR